MQYMNFLKYLYTSKCLKMSTKNGSVKHGHDINFLCALGWAHDAQAGALILFCEPALRSCGLGKGLQCQAHIYVPVMAALFLIRLPGKTARDG